MKKLSKSVEIALNPQEQADILDESNWKQYVDSALKPFSIVLFLPKS
jgi:hypothetical protein